MNGRALPGGHQPLRYPTSLLLEGSFQPLEVKPNPLRVSRPNNASYAAESTFVLPENPQVLLLGLTDSYQLVLMPVSSQDHRPAGFALGFLRCQSFPFLAIYRMGECRIAQHSAGKCTGLAFQGAHQVPIVNGATSALALRRSGPWQVHNALTAQPAFDVLHILPPPKHLSDTPHLWGVIWRLVLSASLD